MYKICKTEESARRQRVLEDCLLKAMEARPYDKITISSLCREAGIPRKAFYRYFSTLHDALLALIDHRLSGSNANAITVWDGGDQFRFETLVGFFTYWQEQKPLLDVLAANNLRPLLLERTTVFVNRQKTGLDQPEISENYETDLPEYFVAYGLMGIVLRWHRDGFPATPEKMASSAAGILAAPGISLTKLLL